MGYLFKDQCLSTVADARDAACSNFDAKIMATANLYTSECTSLNTAASMTICKRTNGGACTNVTQPYPVFRPCDEFAPFPGYLSLEGGALIAGAVLAVWAVGYGFRALIRALNIDSKTSTSESEI